MDVHKHMCHATVMDKQGNVLKQEKFLNREDKFLDIHIFALLANSYASCSLLV